MIARHYPTGAVSPFALPERSSVSTLALSTAVSTSGSSALFTVPAFPSAQKEPCRVGDPTPDALSTAPRKLPSESITLSSEHALCSYLNKEMRRTSRAPQQQVSLGGLTPRLDWWLAADTTTVAQSNASDRYRTPFVLNITRLIDTARPAGRPLSQPLTTALQTLVDTAFTLTPDPDSFKFFFRRALFGTPPTPDAMETLHFAFLDSSFEMANSTDMQVRQYQPQVDISKFDYDLAETIREERDHCGLTHEDTVLRVDRLLKLRRFLIATPPTAALAQVLKDFFCAEVRVQAAVVVDTQGRRHTSGSTGAVSLFAPPEHSSVSDSSSTALPTAKCPECGGWDPPAPLFGSYPHTGMCPQFDRRLFHALMTQFRDALTTQSPTVPRKLPSESVVLSTVAEVVSFLHQALNQTSRAPHQQVRLGKAIAPMCFDWYLAKAVFVAATENKPPLMRSQFALNLTYLLDTVLAGRPAPPSERLSTALETFADAVFTLTPDSDSFKSFFRRTLFGTPPTPDASSLTFAFLDSSFEMANSTDERERLYQPRVDPFKFDYALAEIIVEERLHDGIKHEELVLRVDLLLKLRCVLLGPVPTAALAMTLRSFSELEFVFQPETLPSPEAASTPAPVFWTQAPRQQRLVDTPSTAPATMPFAPTPPFLPILEVACIPVATDHLVDKHARTRARRARRAEILDTRSSPSAPTAQQGGGHSAPPPRPLPPPPPSAPTAQQGGGHSAPPPRPLPPPPPSAPTAQQGGGDSAPLPRPLLPPPPNAPIAQQGGGDSAPLPRPLLPPPPSAPTAQQGGGDSAPLPRPLLPH